jgi:hypothetical protein
VEIIPEGDLVGCIVLLADLGHDAVSTMFLSLESWTALATVR